MSEEVLGRVVQNSSSRLMNNIVSGKKLKEVQSRVLNDLKDAIIHSMGPAGSNSLILRGSSDADIVAEYSKDGNKIIKSIKYQYPIEMAVKSEIENATMHIEKTVGDGTSSVVVMSALIFDALVEEYEAGNLSNDPYEVVRSFKSVVQILSSIIRERKKACTIDDIYNIALISTNGNEEVAKMLSDIYRDYGMNVFIDVSASTNENTYIKQYNGVTIEAGYSDPAMINSLDKNCCRIRSIEGNPVRVYHFADPIDTPEQLGLFQQIIESNIVARRFDRRDPKPEYPTVILAPQISRDAQAYMRRIIQMLHQFGEEEYSQKPQLLIVTNYLGLSENYVDHISTLCGCKPIKKYIDDSIQKKDQESGLAPTIETVCDFYGIVGEVESDVSITKFVDPAKMYEHDESGAIICDENGNPVLSKTYHNIVNFIEAEYNSLSSQGGNAGKLGALKRQLNAVKSNMVELFIGGISISDRDSLRDLVEDAVLNTRSAARYGFGYGANTLGLSIIHMLNKDDVGLRAKEILFKDISYYNIILNIIYDAYRNFSKALYSTAVPINLVDNVIDCIEGFDGIPYNISTGRFDSKVLTSIESEPAILDTISKIITIMFTANQAILQAPSLTAHY